jgi:N-acetylglutamate synthase-like GNAT family acetyltransferase
MTTRILPPAEYPRLVGTEAATIWPQLTDAARVVVVEHDGAIVGCHVLQPVLHAECLWIHPDHRGKTSTPRRLWRAVQRVVREDFGAAWFATAACSDDVRGLLAHVGAVKVDGDHYMVPVGERERCLP